MSFIMVDIEATGPAAGIHSMVELGAVVVRPGLCDMFHVLIDPRKELRCDDETMKFMKWTENSLWSRPNSIPWTKAIREFDDWIKEYSNGYPRFISDNNGFDWQFVNYYFHEYFRRNPFGHSSSNLGQLYKGLKQNMRENFKHLRKTKHTHNALDDAMGNAEAMLEIDNQFPNIFKGLLT